MDFLVRDEQAGQLIEDLFLELLNLIVDLVGLIGERGQEQGEDRILFDALQLLAVEASLPDGNCLLDDLFRPLAGVEYILSHLLQCLMS